MKINEFQDDQSSTYFDLDLNTRQRPQYDKSGVQNQGERRNKPTLTLRHIHQLKLMKKAKRQEYERRKPLINVMYATASDEGGEL